MANYETQKATFSDRIAELNQLLEDNEIDAQEYQDAHDAASFAFGVTVSKWPCK